MQNKTENVGLENANHGEANKQFLQAISSKLKADILLSIAKHYGVTCDEIFSEVTHADAEHLLDYMTEPERSATHLFTQEFDKKMPHKVRH